MRLLPRTDGPLPVLPAPLDRVGDVWAAASGRVRLLVRVVAVTLLLLAASGGLVHGRWGPPVPVLVAARPLASGAPVEPGDVTVASRPRDLVPEDALVDVGDVPDAALTAGPLTTGAVVTHGGLTPDGPATLATPGTAVVAIEAALLPAVPVGTRLDLAVPGLDGTPVVAARGASVVADDGTWRWVRVGRDEVAAVAAGISDGRLVAALLPPVPGAAP